MANHSCPSNPCPICAGPKPSEEEIHRRIEAEVGEMGPEMRERLRVRAAAPELLLMIRDAEWKGSAGRCPWCNEWPADPDKGVEGGHADDCRFTALLKRIDEKGGR